MLPDITNPFFPALVREVQLCAHANGHIIILCNTGGDPSVEHQYLEMLASRQIDGVVAIGFAGLTTELAGYTAGGMRIVFLDRHSGTLDYPVVQADHRTGGCLATGHLLKLGHTRIAHISGPPDLSAAADRYAGYRDALLAAGLEPKATLVASGDFTEASGYRATLALLAQREPFTALFAANDLMALGAIAALKTRGLAVPDELSVVGFDGLELGERSNPTLTTVRQPLRRLGRAVVDQLLALVQGTGKSDPTVTLPVTLVERGSTAPLCDKALTAIVQLRLRSDEPGLKRSRRISRGAPVCTHVPGPETIDGC